MTHIGFTGTQKGMTDAQRLRVQQLILDLGATDFHHGDCVGADDQADDLARSVQCRIHVHPPTIDTKRAFCDYDVIYPALPYLDRNRAIVDITSALIAAPAQQAQQTRSGTWSTVRYAERLGKTVFLVFPSGVTNAPSIHRFRASQS